MKKRILSLLFLFSAFFASAQQDAIYSQYMQNPFIINPGCAGMREVLNASLIARSQWVSIKGAPNTQTLSLSTPLGNRRFGVGINMVADQIGPTFTSGFLASYAYRLTINRKAKLGMGLRAGFYNFHYNWDKISYKDPTDVYYLDAKDNKIVPTADFGLYYYTRNFYLGLSATHIGGPRITSINEYGKKSAQLSSHLFLTGGKAFQMNRKFVFSPSFLIKGTLNAPINIDVNANVQYDKKIWFGVSLRNLYAVVALVQLNVNKQCKIGYSYDFGFGKIGLLARSTHEVYIGYDLVTYKTKTISPRYIY
jgi:type IX secretion system PorP/SprF family membrane protein